MPAALSNKAYPFFITRQSANLLEDLERQLRSSASICVLYGINGVGKSRLVQEFKVKRLADSHKVMLSFQADGNCANLNTSVMLAQQEGLKQALRELSPGSLLILDHYENALSDISMQLFDFLSRVATDKNIGLIIICSTQQALSDIAEQSAKFNLKINSVELKTLSMQESIDFIGSRLCDRSVPYPLFSSKIRKLIKRSNGLFPDLQQFLTEYGSEITCAEKKSLNKTRLSWVLVSLLLLIVGLTVFYDSTSTRRINPELRSQAELEKPDTSKPQAKENLTGEYSPALSTSKPEKVVETDAVIPSKNEGKQKTVSIADIVTTHLNTDIAVEKNSEKTDVTTNPKPIDTQTDSEFAILQQRLRATDSWLTESDDQTASIQIMTLSNNDRLEQALNDYLKRLENKGVELENIRVYKVAREYSRVYGVLYGSYANRQQAINSLKTLPQALNVDKPITRTVKGINQEINKTE